MNGEIPLLGAREDLDLMHALGTRHINLQEDFALGRFLFRIPKLLPAEVPVGIEPTGIAGGQKEAAGAITFRQLSQIFVSRQFRLRFGRGKRL